jgi:hypothetical protein
VTGGPFADGQHVRTSRVCQRPAGETVVMAAFADLPCEPLSDQYGFDRGTPIDRRYIEGFLSTRRDAIHGRVLEVQDNTYTTRFGADRVFESVVIDIDSSNPRATLIADLQQVGSLRRESYDCIILTQTLHLLRQPVAAGPADLPGRTSASTTASAPCGHQVPCLPPLPRSAA